MVALNMAYRVSPTTHHAMPQFKGVGLRPKVRARRRASVTAVKADSAKRRRNVQETGRVQQGAWI